ncbi:bifunctional lysylphosphatidylglycerol synthetase/lysine--tRNA ligase LysX [Brachybacterium hainanense]|uniref:Lysine--tRNA ligase n=1 Tax=Brachybacterium hainanense TaxID=1541174 RepID=A0ABV6R9W4_9MICO
MTQAARAGRASPPRPGRGPADWIGASRWSARDDRWPDRFAFVLLAFAVFNLLVSLQPHWHRVFSGPWDPVSVLFLPVLPGLTYTALLFVLGMALRRRLRAAWWMLLLWWLLVPQISRVIEVMDGYHPVLAGIGLALNTAAIAVLVLARGQFVARRVPGSLRAALLQFLGGGLLLLLGGALLVEKAGTADSYGAAAEYVFAKMLADIGRLEQTRDIHAPWWVHLLIGLAGALVVLTSALRLFRPPRTSRGLSTADEARLRTLLREHGEQDSLGYFATRRDKSVVWDTGEAGDPAAARAGVAYGVFGSVCLASGDPVGDPARWGAAIAAWRAHARSRGLSAAVIGAGEQGGHAFARAGMVVYELGDEAILDLDVFSLAAPGMAPVRQSVRRLRDQGLAVQVRRHSSLSDADFAELAAAAARWRGDGGQERGFSMALGRLHDPLDGDCLLALARDADGALRGFLSFVPWGRTGASLDLMRRDPAAPHGLIELLVTAMAEQAPGFGVRRISLNFAMFREAFERGAEIGAGPLARLWRRSLLLASRTWQLESLYRANAKYFPSWQSRYLCFEFASDLPRVGIATGSAEGFLDLSTTWRSLRTLGHRREEPDPLDAGSSERAAAVRALIPPVPDPVARALSARRLPEQMRVRREKLERLRKRGIDPYPVGAPRSHTLAAVRALAGDLPPDARTGQVLDVAGRILRRRRHGRIGFATLRDGTGDLQILLGDAADAAAWALWRDGLDLGDQISVRGEVMTTRSGEPSIEARTLTLTSKALRPLPDKHHGLTDPEARVRERAIDLIVRPQARALAHQRSAIVRSVRETLHERGFEEVETPVLQTVHGGANARPFTTRIRAYDMDLYLRIATELHLKRLLVGGMEKVFEIGRQFRNEGADLTHNPEFTSLEVYEAYSDYEGMRRLTQRIIQNAAEAVHGAQIARRPGPGGTLVELDLSGDWPVVPLPLAVSRALGEQIDRATPLAQLHAHARRAGLELDPELPWGPVLEELYGALCEKQTMSPVFYTDFPVENAPLARPHRSIPGLAEKWDLVIGGSEQGTAYSELIDPLDQRARLVAQSLLAADGDPEAMEVDEDFLRTLEHGMPPAGGMGLGIDRLVMNLTGQSIREAILFPLVKPERGGRG